jgi:hypothetical protein
MEINIKKLFRQNGDHFERKQFRTSRVELTALPHPAFSLAVVSMSCSNAARSNSRPVRRCLIISDLLSMLNIP